MYWNEALESGIWTAPSNRNKQNFTLRSEIGEAIANVLSDPPDHRDTVYEITSSQAYTLDELTETMSEASGQPIEYPVVSVD